MGNAFSASGGTGKAVRVSDLASSKCSKIPQYADKRAWVLKKLYKVKHLDEFPPNVYSARDADEDIADCRAGVRMRHSYQVVSIKRLEAVKGKDLRKYALQKFHGYPELIDQRTVEMLPYSKQNAATDVRYYRRYKKPYFIIDKATQTVRSRDGKIARQPGRKGTELKYTYNRANIAKKGKFEGGGRKYDVRKYPIQSMKDGSVGRVIPCSVDPVMCGRGQKFFISRDVADSLKHTLKHVAVVNSTIRHLKASHAKNLHALDKKIAKAPAGLKAKLQKQRRYMQAKFKANVAKAKRVEITHPKKPRGGRPTRAELDKKKQAERARLERKKKQAERVRIERKKKQAGRVFLPSSRPSRRVSSIYSHSPQASAPPMPRGGFSPAAVQSPQASAPPMPRGGFSLAVQSPQASAPPMPRGGFSPGSVQSPQASAPPMPRGGFSPAALQSPQAFAPLMQVSSLYSQSPQASASSMPVQSPQASAPSMSRSGFSPAAVRIPRPGGGWMSAV